mmetsp:Transcript_5248/g.7412  ORF Transcript_5248/g.7412 Transcript_5248/m.7412 type:complete len:114 (-) Transcript_5248:1280-1621(-)
MSNILKKEKDVFSSGGFDVCGCTLALSLMGGMEVLRLEDEEPFFFFDVPMSVDGTLLSLVKVEVFGGVLDFSFRVGTEESDEGFIFCVMPMSEISSKGSSFGPVQDLMVFPAF